MALDVAGLLLSLVVLAVTGDQFVIGVARIASSLRLRATVVGALVGGFGTSVAELIVAGLAAARGSTGLADGSLVGSITANVCLALCVAALVSPIRVDSATVRREAPVSVAGVILFAVFAGVHDTAVPGMVMAIAIVPAVVLLLVGARCPDHDDLEDDVVAFVGPEPALRRRPEVVRALVSLVLMFGGAEVMVSSTISLAARLGLAQGFAGLTLVGVGTSAPLIASSVQAARRREHDLVVGNILGGNLFIALAGGAIVGLLSAGGSGGGNLLALGLMGGVVILSWLAMARRSVLSRLEAVGLVVVYCAVVPFAGH